MVNAYAIMSKPEVEAVFKEKILGLVGKVGAYEDKKKELETIFEEELKDASLRESIALIDKLYHQEEVIVKNHCEEAHVLGSNLAQKVGEIKVESNEWSPEAADRFVKYVDGGAIGHDVGKSIFPLYVLFESQKLQENDLKFVKAHPIISYMILRDIPQLRHLLPIILFHEEFYDGGGPVERFLNYELKEAGIVTEDIRISGEDIPIGARVLAIADAYASMVRRGKSKEEIRQEFIEHKSGETREFDPELIELCIREGWI